MNDLYNVEFYSEICCEDCMEVIHNHFDCPICRRVEASTSIYESIRELIEYSTGTFNCEECGAKFKMIGVNEGIWNYTIEYIGDESVINMLQGNCTTCIGCPAYDANQIDHQTECSSWIKKI